VIGWDLGQDAPIAWWAWRWRLTVARHHERRLAARFAAGEPVAVAYGMAKHKRSRLENQRP
jgi:hypothetical protein